MTSRDFMPLAGPTRRIAPASLYTCLGLMWLAWPSACLAQSAAVQSQSVQWVYLLQGEPLRITEDFVAQLDGDKIRIALMDHGIVRPVVTDMQVTLIHPDEPSQFQRPDERGELVFSNVKAGLNVLLVLGHDAASARQSMTYAAFAFFAQLPAVAVNENLPSGAVLNVPMTEVPSRTVLADLSSVSSAGEEGQIMPLDDVPSISPHRFRVATDGNRDLHGRVVAAQAGLERTGRVRIRLSRDGRSVARATTDENGRFTLQNVGPGMYSITAAGQAGYAAFSVEVASPEPGQPAADRRPPMASDGSSFVLQQNLVQDELLILLIPPAVIDQVQEVLQQHIEDTESAAADESGVPPIGGDVESNGDPNASSAGGGGLAMGSLAGGGGGVAAGGGGSASGASAGSAGGLLGAAGLALGVAALANDDDGFSPPIASPITPIRR